MKPPILFLLLIFSLTVSAQNKESFYVFDGNWKPTKLDSAVKYKDEKESEYPGGVGKWGRYLNKNLKYPDRAVNLNIEGEVRILFIVDKEGQVKEPYVAKSVEYSLDEESLRIVQQSGKWDPAFQNGKYVNTYKVQPINFRLK